jgi:alpha-L-fucosidase
MPARLLFIVLLGTLLVPGDTGAQQSAAPAWDMLAAKPEVVQAWQDRRFGMFVCWGPVTLTGLEIGWSRGPARPDQKQGGGGPTPADVYDRLYTKWTPDRFDARQWVKIAQEGGMKYMIFLVKHHDGFCLYDTRLTDYKSTGPAAAWKHDVMREVADACHEAHLPLIVYYSQPDWHHPDYRTANHRRYLEYFHGQIRELLTSYGRIDGLWFDLGGTPEDWDSERLFKMARSLQPWLIINNRCGLRGDFDTPEQQVGRQQFDRPWESCITLGTQWSWKPEDDLKPYSDAVKMLATCAAGDGNLALNTNPMPDGRIEPRQAESFRQIGQWLKKYGESIYSTRGGPFVAPGMGSRRFGQDLHRFDMPGGDWWGGSTHRDRTVYLHILRWPSDTISLPGAPRKIVRHSVLTGGEAAVRQTEQGIQVSVPPASRDPIDTIIRLELDGPASDIPILIPVQKSGSLAFGKKATASNYFQKDPHYAPEKAVDDDLDTRWGCDYGTHSCWLEVDLGEPQTFRRAFISEPYGRVREYEIQVWNNGRWQTFHRGTTLGENCTLLFAPVTGRRVRLNLLKTTEGPSIWEFQLFGTEK